MDSIILKKILSAGFLFIDIPRTSSTSLRVELGRIYGAPYSKSNTIEKEFAQPQGFPDHLPAIAMKNLLGNENWEKLFIFTLVRNPWDRTLSMYNWRVMVNNIPSSLDFRAYVIRLRDYLSGVKYGNYHDGYNYSNEKLFQFRPHSMSCSDFIYDDSGDCMVDFIGKYENRTYDIKTLSEKLNINLTGTINTQRSGKSISHYSEKYDEETKQIVETIYADDIQKFGYSYEVM